MLLRYALLTLAIALPVHAAQPLTVDWLDLLPAEDYQAMLDMPDIEHGFGPDADGNFDTSLRQREGLPEVMYSTRVVGEYDGKELRIGGCWKPTIRDATPASFWCRTPAPASMCRHHRPTRSSWSSIRMAW